LHVSWQVERGVDTHSRKRGDHPSARVTVACAQSVSPMLIGTAAIFDQLHDLAPPSLRQ
jgi:hypothetical protein